VRAFLPVQSGNRERTRDRPRSAAVFAAFDDPRFVEAVLDSAGDLAVARDRFLDDGELGRRALALAAGRLGGADLERAVAVLAGARERDGLRSEEEAAAPAEERFLDATEARDLAFDEQGHVCDDLRVGAMITDGLLTKHTVSL